MLIGLLLIQAIHQTSFFMIIVLVKRTLEMILALILCVQIAQIWPQKGKRLALMIRNLLKCRLISKCHEYIPFFYGIC